MLVVQWASSSDSSWKVPLTSEDLYHQVCHVSRELASGLMKYHVVLS